MKIPTNKKKILGQKNTTSGTHIFCLQCILYLKFLHDVALSQIFNFIKNNRLPNVLNSAIFTFLKGNFYQRHLCKFSARWQTIFLYIRCNIPIFVWHNTSRWECKIVIIKSIINIVNGSINTFFKNQIETDFFSGWLYYGC